VDTLAASPSFLAVADARRPSIGRAVLGALLVAGLFEVFALGVKEYRSLGDHAPWMDDPYDVVTSFAIFLIPIVAAFSAVRLALCRRVEPLPLSRVIDLLHGCVLLLVVTLAWAGSDWIALVVGADRGSWTAVTPALVAGLGLLTLIALLATAAVVVEGSRLPRPGVADPADPDWLADVTALAGRISRRLGPFETGMSRIVRVVDLRVWAWVRRRPITTAVLVAAGSAVLFAVGGLRERYPPPLLAFVFVVAWCGMFALLVASGSYLGVVRSSVRMSVARRRSFDAVLVASASVPIALALRDPLWSIVSPSIERSGVADLASLLAVTAASAAGLTLLIETIARVHEDRGRAI
jgi:hypothetical protein